MIDFFKKKGFLIMTFSIAICVLIEFFQKNFGPISDLKYLIYFFAFIGILGAIGMMVESQKRK